MERLSLAAARRIALHAQGFGDPQPTGRPDRRHLRRVVGRTALLQIDSVNVFERAHFLPVFSRVGPYDKALVERAAYRDRELFEYWGHEASLLPVATHPLLRWRMARAEALEELPEADRELLRLWAWEQLPPRELAVVLGVSANAVSIRLHRARQRLKERLDARKNGDPTGQTGTRRGGGGAP